MKPTLLVLPFLLLTFFGYSQRVDYPPAPSSVYAPYGENTSSQIKATLWSDDISDALNWGFTNTSVPLKDWSIETDPELVSISGPFQSSSFSDGFLLFKADTSQGSTSDAYAEFVGAQIDLSAEANIRIQFEQQYISDANERTLEVSQDGITWFPFVISDGMSPSGAKEDRITSIDISTAAGNASDLHFRFHFSGSSEGYWAIDDIELRSIDPVDLRASSVDWGTTGVWGVRMPYYSIVSQQLQPIEFCVDVANDGLLDVDTAIHTVSVPLAFFTASDSFAIQSNTEASICNTTTLTPPGVGAYTLDQSISSTVTEQDLLNNDFASTQFNVLEGNWIEYARDDLITGIQGGIVGSGLFEYEVGNVFDIFASDFCNVMQVQIHPNAPIDAYVEGLLYVYDPLAGFIQLDQTLGYTVSAADLGQSVDLSLANGTPLDSDRSYLATVRTYWLDQTDPSEVVVATSGKSKPNTSFLRYYSSPTTLETYHLTETPMVRLIFSPEGLDENQSSFNLNVAPNPSNQSTTLSFDLTSSSAVSFELIDLSGKTIRQVEPKLFSEGNNELELTTSDLVNGVYFVKFISDFGSATKRIVVQH